MDRLTKRCRDGYSLNHENCPKRGQCNDSADCVDALLERLAAYEDAEEKREKLHAETRETASHSEAAILRGCISLMQTLTGRFEEYLDFIDFHPDNEEERFCTEFYMTEIVERLFLWETHHSGGTSQHLKLKALGVDAETVTFEDDRETED